jgi:acyl dehydratase
VAAGLHRLLDWQLPDAVQSLTRRDVAFYALSIGAGRNPRDRGQLRYVDPASAEFRALPSMALVMGYPGFWLGDPRLQLDVGRILHVEQSVEILGPIPVEGRIVGRTRVVDVVDRGPGKGVLVHSEREVSEGSGRTFARLRQVHTLRGYGGFSSRIVQGDAGPQQVRPGCAAAVIDIEIRPEQALLYRLNGDMNPMHSDPAVAGPAGFPAPLLHGMCTFGIVAKKLIEALCEDKADELLSMSARFTGPIYPGETLRTEIQPDGSFRSISVERNAPVLGNGLARIAVHEKPALEVDHAI